MKKFIIVLVAALVLCVPALAVNESYFSASPFSYTDYIYDGFCEQSDSSQTVYFYAIANGTVRAISETQNAPFQCGRVHKGTGNTPNYSSKNCNVAIGNYYGADCFTIQQSIESTTPSISVFPSGTTDAEISSAFADFLNNLPTPAPAVASSFTVPCGNVLYFQVSSEQDVTLSAQMPQLSYLVQFGNNAYGPWGDTGIEYGPAAALPSSGTTFPILSMDSVQWTKGEPKNILGQSMTGIATKRCIVGQWYALFCPLTSPQVLDASTGDHAMGASVVVSGSFSQIKVYPLSETLDYDNPLGATYESGSNDGYDSYFDGSSDDNGTVSWTNQDGQVQAPQSGGTNYVSPAANAESLLSQIRQLLANIVSELKSLFTFGYEAVQDLAGIMRDFVNVLGGLYTWLPAEVYSALMSAVVVAIVIGVFKVFL